jgi:hypothetical protein
MSQKFSQELVQRLKRYFQQYHGLAISDNQAVLYLDLLGNLFITFNSLRRPARQQTRKCLRRQDSHSYT